MWLCNVLQLLRRRHSHLQQSYLLTAWSLLLSCFISWCSVPSVRRSSSLRLRACRFAVRLARWRRTSPVDIPDRTLRGCMVFMTARLCARSADCNQSVDQSISQSINFIQEMHILIRKKYNHVREIYITCKPLLAVFHFIKRWKLYSTCGHNWKLKVWWDVIYTYTCTFMLELWILVTELYENNL